MMKWSMWALLPPLYFLGTATGLWVVYFAAVKNEKIVPLTLQYRRPGNGSMYFPYISVAGNFPPGSCIFSQVMNLAAFGGLIICVFRYLQLKNTMGKSLLNIGSVIAFSVSCFGMTLVGNFQLFYAETIHNTGTFMVFGMGALFCWMQSVLTLYEGKRTALVRFLLSASITVCMIIHFTVIAMGLHMDGARSQWVLVMFFLIFMSTFAVEFRHCHFDLIVEYSRCPPQRFSEMHQSDRWSNPNLQLDSGTAQTEAQT